MFCECSWIKQSTRSPSLSALFRNTVWVPGLSLRAGGRGFSPATRSLNPSYFDTERKYWKEKNASNYKIMNYKTKQYFTNTNSYSSFKVRRPHNPCETDWNHEMFNNVYLSEARDFTKCSFHLVLLFSEFHVPQKCHPKNERQKWTNKENWISSSLLAPLQVKLCLTEDRLDLSISLLNRPVRSGLNKFAEDESGLVVVTHGLNVVAL